MDEKKHTPKYTAEFRERGVRLYREQRPDYTSDNAAYRAIASKLGCSHDTLRAWCIQAARDAGQRSGPSSEEKARIKELEREVKELRTANEILKKGETIFRHWSEDNGRTRILPRRSSTARSANDRLHPLPGSRYVVSMRGEDHREVYGVEPICRVLPIAPATFHRHAAIAHNPELASDRARQDAKDVEEIRQAHDKSRGRYGARKVFAIGLERMATRWLTIICAATTTISRAAP